MVASESAQQADETPHAGERICLFSVAGEVVGVPVSALFEVVSEPLITSLPEVPAGLVGLMNLRGEILPVVDLGPWIGIPVIPRLQVMVVSGGGYQIGVAVDTIRDMVDAALGPEEAEGVDDARLGGALRRVSGDRLRGATAPAARVWIVDAGRLVAELTQTFTPVAEVV